VWQRGGLIAIPLASLYAFVCLLGLVCVPRHAARGNRRVADRDDALTASAIATAMWLLAARIWVGWLQQRGWIPPIGIRAAGLYALLSAIGALLYLLSLAVSHLIPVFDHTRAAERRALQVQILAREAEVRMLRADRSALPVQRSPFDQCAHQLEPGCRAAHVRPSRGLPAREPGARLRVADHARPRARPRLAIPGRRARALRPTCVFTPA
jgi:hypothetical protein